MSISARDLRSLYQRSGNRCAFPGCSKSLTFQEPVSEQVTPISEVAHIVASSYDGPRGKYPLPLEERDKYANLILLCEEHHHIVDANPASYPVEMLHRWKDAHEQLMNRATELVLSSGQSGISSSEYSTEVVYSTLLPVVSMPRYIYSAPCMYNDSQESAVNAKVIYPQSGEMTPFIIRSGRLYCFNNLKYGGNPFREVIDDTSVSRYESHEWWEDPDFKNWYVQLLNRALNKLTGRKGLNWDREHGRYYFQPQKKDEPLTISYQPLNQAVSKRQVVWEPISKKTGEGKGYWFHLAIALRFHQVNSSGWCLSMRPEMHVSSDGFAPYPSKIIGRRITRRISRRHNYDLLGDIQFWRNFLSDGKPRIILPFDRKQYIEISSTILDTTVSWPGMPEEHAKSFKNVELPETLFSWAEMERLGPAAAFAQKPTVTCGILYVNLSFPA